MKKIKRILIHHSASDWGTANIIRQWHLERGWVDIGYHFVIGNGIPTYEDYIEGRRFETMIGQIEYGRPLDADEWLEAEEVGAHAYGFNSDSIGICLIHKSGQYHPRMLRSLIKLVKELVKKYDIPIQNVVGHYELDKNKPMCPSIRMDILRAKIGAKRGIQRTVRQY